MCLQCIAGAVTIAENVLPGYSLMQSTKDVQGWPLGWYGLVQSDDPTFVFPTLTQEPVFGDEDASPEANERHKAFIAAGDELRDNMALGLNEAGNLYLACMGAGYFDQRTHGFVEYWLLDHLAKLVVQLES